MEVKTLKPPSSPHKSRSAERRRAYPSPRSPSQTNSILEELERGLGQVEARASKIKVVKRHTASDATKGSAHVASKVEEMMKGTF